MRFAMEFSFSQDKEIVPAVEKLLISKGYQKENYEYELLFKKGDGFIKEPSFIKLFVENNTLKVEAFTKNAFGFGVFFGEKAPKSKELKGLISEVENIILSSGGVKLGEGVVVATAAKALPSVAGIARGEFEAKHLSASLGKEINTSAAVFCIMALVNVVVGLIAGIGAEDSTNLLVMLPGSVVLAVVALLAKRFKSSLVLLAASVVGFLLAAWHYMLMFSAFTLLFDNLFDNDSISILAVVSILLFTLVATIFMLTGISSIITFLKINKYYNILNAEKEKH